MDANEQRAAEIGLAEQIRNIRANAELVVRMFARETDFGFGYDQESVQWLDAYIEQIRTSKWTEEEFTQLVSNLGSYLGEAIIKSFGGKWSLDQRGWAIRWDDFNLAYPFIRVAKQLQNGESDSIYSFFAVTGALRKSSAPRTPLQ
jgi:hypothetical protein